MTDSNYKKKYFKYKSKYLELKKQSGGTHSMSLCPQIIKNELDNQKKLLILYLNHPLIKQHFYFKHILNYLYSYMYINTKNDTDPNLLNDIDPNLLKDPDFKKEVIDQIKTINATNDPIKATNDPIFHNSGVTLKQLKYFLNEEIHYYSYTKEITQKILKGIHNNQSIKKTAEESAILTLLEEKEYNIDSLLDYSREKKIIKQLIYTEVINKLVEKITNLDCLCNKNGLTRIGQLDQYLFQGPHRIDILNFFRNIVSLEYQLKMKPPPKKVQSWYDLCYDGTSNITLVGEDITKQSKELLNKFISSTDFDNAVNDYKKRLTVTTIEPIHKTIIERMINSTLLVLNDLEKKYNDQVNLACLAGLHDELPLPEDLKGYEYDLLTIPEWPPKK
jgi:hypothetical protein